jgi:hypothetical protein
MQQPLIDPGGGRSGGARFFCDLPVWMTLVEQPHDGPALGEVGQLPKSAKVPEEGSRLLLGPQG